VSGPGTETVDLVVPTTPITHSAPPTLPAALLELAARRPGEVALRHRRLGRWREYTWGEVADRAARVGVALEGLGVRPGDGVVIQSENRPAWLFVDLGAQGAGAAVLGVPPSASTADLETHLRQARATVLLVDDERLLARAAELRSRLPELGAIVVLEPGHEAVPEGVFTFDALLDQTDDALASFRERVARLDPDEAAIIALTSGTTGPQRGVVFSHRATVAAASGLGRAAGLDHRDEILSCLPLHHVTERMLAFASIAGTRHVTNIGQRDEREADLCTVEPTFLLSTPQLWQDVRAGVEARIEAASRPSRIAYARFVDRREPTNALAGAVGSLVLTRPLRRQIGLRRLRRAWIVSAPASPGLGRWLDQLGVSLGEVYGLTEQGGYALVSTRADRSGKPADAAIVPGVELRVDEDGEVLMRGPAMLSRYLDEPITLDPEGWLRTGDAARVDLHGRPVVVGRRSDAIVTRDAAAGVHPGPIERRLRACKHIDEVVVVGDDDAGLVALVAIHVEMCARWAAHHDIAITSRDAIFAHPAIRELIEARVAEINHELPGDERIDRVVLLPAELRRVDGDLAQLLQPRRHAIAKRFAAHWKEDVR
jgi:long-chain acyl-CoA synthetase